MASDIQLSQAVRQNLLSLQNTADMMSRTQTRLATGNKVNSALDNPTNFFTASGLNARAGELNGLLDSMSNAISTIEAADKGLTSITKMVEQMQATVRQAQQVKADDLSFTSLAPGGGTAPTPPADAAIVTAYNSASGATLAAPGGGATDPKVTNKAAAVSDTGKGAIAGTTFSFDYDPDGTGATGNTRYEYTTGGVANNDTVSLDFKVGGEDVSLDIYTNDTGQTQALSVDDVVDGINQAALKSDDNGQFVRARKDDNGDLVVEAVGGRSLSIVYKAGVAANATYMDEVFGTAPTADAQTSSAKTTGQTGTVDGEIEILRNDVNKERNDFATQFNELRGQLNDLAEDASFNGINLLQDDDLKVLFNELTGANQSKLDIDGEQVDTEWLNVKKIHTATDLASYNPAVNEGDFQSDEGLEASLDELSNALKGLRSFAAKLGSNLSVVQIRKDFTKDMVNTLQSGAAKLTLADTNEEGANMLALQTRQQLSSTALSLSSQADQNVLRLF